MVQQLMHRLVADPGLGSLVIETRATNETIRFQIAADVGCIRVVESLLGELVPGMQTVTAGVRRAGPVLSIDPRVRALWESRFPELRAMRNHRHHRGERSQPVPRAPGRISRAR